MKKLFILLNAALILLVGCSADTAFSSSENSEMISLTGDTSIQNTDSTEASLSTSTTAPEPEKEYSEILLNAINTKGELFRVKYEPFYITDVTISTGYDYNYDGVDDYIVVFNTYMQFDMVFFDGVTAEIIREIHQMTMFLEKYVKIELYTEENGEDLFKRFNRYQMHAVSDALNDQVQIDFGEKGYSFLALYDSDNVFIHAYDEYPDEESYLAAQDALLEGYDYVTDIKWAGSFDYMDENALQALTEILNK